MTPEELPVRALRTSVGGIDVVTPGWGGAIPVVAFTTLRAGGVSTGGFGAAGGGGLNLGSHCGDAGDAVAENRARVAAVLPATPHWLMQVHGTIVHDADRGHCDSPRADAAFTFSPSTVLVVQTADCLPVLVAERRGRAVAAAHAGWRGLASGVLEATVEALVRRGVSPHDLLAWIGPGIGGAAYEVGEEVRDAFRKGDDAATRRFAPGIVDGKWFADLRGLAADRLRRLGVREVSESGMCTYRDADECFSYRRDGRTGRMGTFIWIAPD